MSPQLRRIIELISADQPRHQGKRDERELFPQERVTEKSNQKYAGGRVYMDFEPVCQLLVVEEYLNIGVSKAVTAWPLPRITMLKKSTGIVDFSMVM